MCPLVGIHPLQQFIGAAGIINLIKHGSIIIRVVFRIQFLFIKQLRISGGIDRQYLFTILIKNDQLVEDCLLISGNQPQITKLLFNLNGSPIIDTLCHGIFLNDLPFLLRLIKIGNCNDPLFHMSQKQAKLLNFYLFPKVQHNFISSFHGSIQYHKAFRHRKASQPEENKKCTCQCEHPHKEPVFSHKSWKCRRILRFFLPTILFPCSYLSQGTETFLQIRFHSFHILIFVKKTD